MIKKREPKQSLLDYLWVRYGEDLSRVEQKDGQLIGYNEEGTKLFELEYSGSSSGSSSKKLIADFGINEEDRCYYIRLTDGTEFTAPIESLDVSRLEVIVEANTQALQIINGDGEGSLINILKLAKEYTDSKVNDTDVSKLKEQVDKNSSDLVILKGSVEEEGSVLNIIDTFIKSAFEWETISN